METNELPKVDISELKAIGVQSLADRPNEMGQYGVGGLSAKQLKEHFDAAVIYLAEKYNQLLLLFGTTDFLGEIKWSTKTEVEWALPDDSELSLAHIKRAMKNGDFLELINFTREDRKMSVASVLRSLLSSISTIKELNIEASGLTVKDGMLCQTYTI
ncbi:MAG: hypothetical protein IKA46_02880 [Clostridia bacterium]|nr:hypothetical protein [Clostridia bacterium]MBR3862731.1 hypothetical protein [Clostridia bacterium]